MKNSMKNTARLKVLLLCTIIALTFIGVTAQADSPVGHWVGSFSGSGKSDGASASFSSGGSCSVSTLGLSASGSYGGGSMHVSAYGYSITLHYSVSGNHMTISGSKGGYHGSMSLRRVGGANNSSKGAASEKATNEKNRLFGTWTTEVEGTRYEVSVYQDGFLYWSETPVAEGSEAQIYGARLMVSADKFTLTPLDQVEPGDVPAIWPALEEKDVWELSYSMDGDSLKLMQGTETLLTLSRVKDTEATPAEAIFRPYIILKEGKRGDAVKQLQNALITSGYLDGMADGDFGPKTKKAVKAFQTANGIHVDGIAGKEVLSVLFPE